MLGDLWNSLLYEPLLNTLAFLVDLAPGGDIGLAVILLTLLVKVVLFPLSKKSIENQAKVALLTPEINKIKESGKSKEEQARLTLELYKKHKTNPFSGCLPILIQLPIIFALYRVFLSGLDFSAVKLYSFVPYPESINTLFLGGIDMTGKSLLLAILTGLTQFLLGYLMPKPQITNTGKPETFQESLTKSMHLQMRYVLPVFIAFVAYSLSGAIALYWLTSNIFAIGQQLYFNKKKKEAVATVVN